MTSRRLLKVDEVPEVPAAPAALTRAVGYLVNEVAALFRVTFEQLLAKHQLRRQQYHMLLVLRDEGPMSQQALGQRLGIDRTTTMQLAQALADSGSVDRRDDPSDRRVYMLSLTPGGRRLTATLESVIRRAESELLAPLAADDRAAFAAQLRAILAAQTVRH